MATFLLVHGAWNGGWNWTRTAKALRAAGHEVFAPTLTGLGERSHLMSREIDLETHIDDILGVVKWERLDRFCLVGHSYGGMPITGVADRIADRISSIIYLDAAVPKDGEAMLELTLPERKASLLARAEAEGEGYMVPPITAAAWGVEDPEEVRQIDAYTCMHPLRTLTQPIRIAGNHLKIARKTYIVNAKYDPSPFHKFAAWAREQPDWTTVDLPCHHFPMISMPEETAALLIEHGA